MLPTVYKNFNFVSVENQEQFYIADQDLTTSMKLVRFYFQRLSPLTPKLASRFFWRLFTSPRKRKWTDAEEKFYASSEGSAAISDEFQRPYTIWKRGTGTKKVLILHGWESRASDFRRLIEGLEEDAELYIVDFPGHGKSPDSIAHLPIFVDVIKSAAKEIGCLDWIIGHSLGAASLSMAVVEPDFKIQVGGLIFMGLHPIPSNYFLQYKSVTRVSERVFEECIKLAQERTGKALLEYNCYDHLDTLNKYKIVFIHDEKDAIIRPERVVEFASKIENGQLFVGDHGGHFRHYKNQEVIAKIQSVVSEKKDPE